ncbi:ABC transporter substrate-binding protein [Nocardioides sp. cx-169]|uniref:heme/hemin ABC transporter substrate-binding protein n=1 Tax=Nocardioides sp. cx-169 TaxID=2899080 RepID=UPI001E2BA143|nr:ABC transporter substrate-binding protein [Nocardioides sp. cx-169]MCD4533932.1 ABC transporter substrate-binding protein [Nocardioides sp. cx-169]
MSRPQIAALLAAFTLSACGPVLDSPGDEGDATTAAAPAPRLSDVTPVDDPRAWQGEVSINLPDPVISPAQADPEPRLPVTVTDAQGTKVTVTDTSRILALDVYGTLAHTVFELGLGDRVVGRDVSSSFPEIADRPVVTQNGHELSAEAILDLDPTVVLSDTSLGPFDVLLQLRDAGIPVVITDADRSLDNLSSLTQEVADALGVPAAGRELGQRLERDADRITRQVAEVAPQDITGQLRTIFLYVRGQAGVYYMFGEGSGADSLITAAGGYNVAAEIGWSGMKPVNDEGLIAAAPDAILMMNEGLESVGGVDGLLKQFPALTSTPAGENRRIIAMDDDQVLSFGPRAADVINALAVAFYAPDDL